MKPLAGNVLICPAEGNRVSGTAMGAAFEAQAVEGSAILRPGPASKVQSKPSEGIVRAIGPEVTITIGEGDRVLYRSWTGIEVRLDGKDHQLTPQRDVLAIVEDGEQLG